MTAEMKGHPPESLPDVQRLCAERRFKRCAAKMIDAIIQT
jgi:hypothetical protein